MAATTCPCEGLREYSWHHKNKVPQCAHSRQTRKEYRKNRKLGVIGWIPGTPIYVPEYETP